MNPFRREETPFITDVAQHAGNYRGITDGLECWEIRDPKQEPFKDILQAVCLGLSQCHSIPRSTLVLIDIFLRGKTRESSAAYVMLSGATLRHRKTAVRHLRRSSLLREYPGLKVDQWDWPPQAPNITMTGKKGEAPDKNLLYRCPKFDIRRLASGNAEDNNDIPNGSLLSIIAMNDGEETSRAGTLSCVVMVGQDDFFFAPAHIFMPRPPEEPEEDVDMEDSESDCGSEMLRAGSATPSDLCSDSEATTDDIVQEGLSGSWSMLEGGADRPNSTQPSPTTEGFEIFSPEHDYALVPVPRGETFHQELCCISREIVECIDRGQFAVSVMTPSRGLMNGWLDGRPTLMRLPYSSKFTQFYPISFPDAVSEGDCGSLVIDQITKQIYGFIVAASIEGRVAYIVSAEEILQDITARLGKECGRGQTLESMASADHQLSPSSKYGGSSARSSAINHPAVTRVFHSPPNKPVQSVGLPSELSSEIMPPSLSDEYSCPSINDHRPGPQHIPTSHKQMDLSDTVESRELPATVSMGPSVGTGTSRTVYLAKTPPDTSAEEIMSHVSSGQGSLNGSPANHFGHASKPSNNDTGFSRGALNSNISGFADRNPRRGNIPSINTQPMSQQPFNNGAGMTTPGTAFDMQFTPLLPSQLLLGSPFQPGTPAAFASPQFQNLTGFEQAQQGGNQQQQNGASSPVQQNISPQSYQGIVFPSTYGAPQFYPPQSPTGGFGMQASLPPTSPVSMGSAVVTGTSRTVYLGKIPPDTVAEEILGHVRSGQIESVRLLPDKDCAFISFLDASSATHFHSDAILKKLCIKGQDIKIGWGKPSQVPTSVALAVQQSGASRNVYLGNLPEEVTEEELREDLGKFGAIDTIKIVREKNIAFVHYLSIANAIKAVSQLPQEPKWQAPRRVYYGKDRCAYVSKTQQQNAAQYLGIAPGYAHMLTGADRDLISNALAQQSVAAAAVATTAGGINNLGNRTIYLGNIHPVTTIEEICNVVRGGLLHHIRYIPDKHICFVTFIDPTAAAFFYALSNLQGLMIHNRRLEIGWGKHSGALPPVIALAISGGASRNIYIGNLDETWTEERLRQDFSEYGEIELVDMLREKRYAFVNFTNIANAIKAIEAIRGRDEYKKFKVNFGKDRCGNPPRQMQQSQSPRGEGVASPPPNGSQNGGSPTNGNTLQQSAALFKTSSSPLTMYLNQQYQQQQQIVAQQSALFGTAQPSPSDLGLDVPQQIPMSGHGQSASISNG